MIILGLIFRGSHFDSDNKVDKYRNSAMTRLYHKQHDEEPVLRISSIDSGTASSDKISEENIKERAQEYAKQTNKLIQSDIDREERQRLYTSSDELKDQEKNQPFSDEFDEEDDAILDETQRYELIESGYNVWTERNEIIFFFEKVSSNFTNKTLPY